MEGQKTMTREEKRKAWNYALGMMQVDGVKPDEEYLELVEKEINGEITIDEMELIILKQYDETGRYK